MALIGLIGLAALLIAVVVVCWPARFRIPEPRAETLAGALFVFGLVLIGVGLSVYFR